MPRSRAARRNTGRRAARGRSAGWRRLHALGLKRRALGERRVIDRRAKVRESAERLAQREQRRFGTLRRQAAVELRMADGAEQDRIRAQRGSSVFSGRPAPSLSMAAPPIGWVENENEWPECSATFFRMRTASSVTSGPMPSPGSSAIFSDMRRLPRPAPAPHPRPAPSPARRE